MNKQHVVHPFIIGYGSLGRAIEKNLERIDPSNLLFICVKAFDLEKVLQIEEDRIADARAAIILSNGHVWPLVRAYAESHPSHHVRIGMTTMGATILQDGSLKIYAEGSKTMWGPVRRDQAEPTAEELKLLSQMAHQGWSFKEDMGPWLRRKWIFNATINTLCAALRLSSNGKLENHRTLVNDVFGEAFVLGHQLWPDLEFKDNIDELRAELWRVIEKTRDNENSMARDVRLGRKTENGFLAGLATDLKGFQLLKTYHIRIEHFTSGKEAKE
jgi:2-dehydropantoate 2-reductase